MQMEALLAGEPSFDPGMFVRGVVVANDVDLFVWSHGVLYFLEKGQPFIVAVPLCGMCQHFAAQVVQRGKESHRSVPIIIMGAGADMAHSERQARLSALESLALTFLVTAQNHRVLRRVQVKADDVPGTFVQTPDRWTT